MGDLLVALSTFFLVWILQPLVFFYATGKYLLTGKRFRVEGMTWGIGAIIGFLFFVGIAIFSVAFELSAYVPWDAPIISFLYAIGYASSLFGAKLKVLSI